MTDFAPESAWSESTHPSHRDFWESTRPAPFQEHRIARPSQRTNRRPSSLLATDVGELLESMVRKRVPRLDGVRARLERARGEAFVQALEQALHGLHATTTALDFLASRESATAGQFAGQARALVEAAAAFRALGIAYTERQASEAPLARLLWLDLVLESGSLHKRVRQAARWLAEIDQDLVTRRRFAHPEASARAIDDMARRTQIMHTRVQAVHRLCSHARTVHLVCEQLAQGQVALCTTLQERVAPACDHLAQALEPLLQAATQRALAPSELIAAIDARHELQVVLTQAGAQIIRLQDSDAELVSQLSWMQQRAASVA